MLKTSKQIAINKQIKLNFIIRWTTCSNCNNFILFELMYIIKNKKLNKTIGKYCKRCVKSKKEIYNLLFSLDARQIINNNLEHSLTKEKEKVRIAINGFKKIISHVKEIKEDWNPKTENVLLNTVIDAENSLREMEKYNV